VWRCLQLVWPQPLCVDAILCLCVHCATDGQVQPCYGGPLSLGHSGPLLTTLGCLPHHMQGISLCVSHVCQCACVVGGSMSTPAAQLCTQATSEFCIFSLHECLLSGNWWKGDMGTCILVRHTTP